MSAQVWENIEYENQNKISKLKKGAFSTSFFKTMSTYSEDQVKVLARLRIEEIDGLTRASFEKGLEDYLQESHGSSKTRRRNILAARKLFRDFTFREDEKPPTQNLMPRRVKSKVVIPPR